MLIRSSANYSNNYDLFQKMFCARKSLDMSYFDTNCFGEIKMAGKGGEEEEQQQQQGEVEEEQILFLSEECLM